MHVFPQAFELATGDYLFEPHSGDDYSRDEGGSPLIPETFRLYLEASSIQETLSMPDFLE